MGTSIPTNLVPGIGAITLTLLAFITLERSSERFVNLFTLTPSSGSISNKVITGPWLILLTLPLTPKVSSAYISSSAF